MVPSIRPSIGGAKNKIQRPVEIKSFDHLTCQTEQTTSRLSKFCHKITLGRRLLDASTIPFAHTRRKQNKQRISLTLRTDTGRHRKRRHPPPEPVDSAPLRRRPARPDRGPPPRPETFKQSAKLTPPLLYPHTTQYGNRRRPQLPWTITAPQILGPH